jgi:hypothetical protein
MLQMSGETMFKSGRAAGDLKFDPLNFGEPPSHPLSLPLSPRQHDSHAKRRF